MSCVPLSDEGFHERERMLCDISATKLQRE